ncbi:MAG: hypothetical protein LIP08_10760 [Bacteroides sp.]|nr:hypothetical protein [Bacteroides sp.]
MGKKKLNEVQAVSSIKDSEYILVTMEDGSVGRIRKSDLYPLASSSTNGLLNKGTFSQLGNFGLPRIAVPDVDKIHTIAPGGLSVYNVAASTLNSPSAWGMLMNLQYAAYSAIDSHCVAQVFFNRYRKIFVRIGITTGQSIDSIEFGDWREI